MPAPIRPEVVAQFDRMLAAGHTARAAAKAVGVSEAWAYDRSKGRRKRDQAKFYSNLDEDKSVAPRAVDKLKPEARKALKDFEYFRLRYTGRSSVPWQVEAANQIVELLETPDKEYVVLNAPPGGGKALALDTPIPTPSGWTTMKALEVGDEVFGSDGRRCRVVAKSDVFYGHDCYEVKADDGASVIADADHLWSVRLHGHGQYGGWERVPDHPGKTGPKASPDGRHVHTTEFLAKKRSKRPQLQIAEPLALPEMALPLDPYALGAWLGDGHSAGARFTCHEDDAPHFESEFRRAGWQPVRQKVARNVLMSLQRPDTDTCYRGHPSNRSANGNCRDCRALAYRHERYGEPMPGKIDPTPTERLRQMGLLGNKHIPEMYFRSSVAQRMALLQGLVDTDGSVDAKGQVEFCNTNRNLAEGVQALVRSLGAKASLNTGRAVLNGKDCGERYRVTFRMVGAARLPRKAERCRDGVRTPHRYMTVTKVESVPTQCIAVDSPDHLYLAGEGLMVTHNSSLFTHDIPLWLICRNRSIRILIGSSIQRSATKYSNRLRRSLQATRPHLATDDELIRGQVDAKSCVTEDFGRFKPDNQNPDLWRAEEFAVAQPGNVSVSDKEPTVQAFGYKGGVLGNRVDFVVWDDLIDAQNQRTMEAREEMRDWWKSTAETRLDPGGLMILQGQRMGSDDLYRFALDLKDIVLDEEGNEDPEAEEPSKYRHIVYKAHYTDMCQGSHPRTLEPWPASCLLDPFKLPWRELARNQKNDLTSFLTQYQQEDADAANSLVQKIYITGGHGPNGEVYPGCWDDYRGTWELPQGLTGDVVIYATVDPSPTRWWGVQTWAWHPDSEQYFLLDLVRRKMRMSEFLEYDIPSGELRGLAVEWQEMSRKLGHEIRTWIVERNAAVDFFGYQHTQRFISKYGVGLLAHTTSNNKSDPKYGVDMLGPLYRTGRVRLPGKQTDGSRLASLKLIEEVLKWPNGGTDDQVMSQWFGTHNVGNLYTPVVEAPRLHAPWRTVGRGVSRGLGLVAAS